MSGSLNKEWFWQDNFCYEEDLLNKYSKYTNYTVQIYVALSSNKLFLDGLRSEAFQPTSLYLPFMFTHSISKRICKISVNKNYV